MIYDLTHIKDHVVCKTIVDQFPTSGEMVRVEGLSDDQLIAKISVLHCMMMSHGGELLSCYHGLNQSHHEYVLATDSRLKGYEEKVAGLTRLELQGLVWKFLDSDEFSRIQGEPLSLAASAGFERGLKEEPANFALMVIPSLNSSDNEIAIRVLGLPTNEIREFGHVGWGKVTWGGRVGVLGIVPVCVCTGKAGAKGRVFGRKGCSKHMTGNRALLTNFVEKFLGTVCFGNNDFAVIAGYGDVVIGLMKIKKVYYVEGLGHNLFSVGQFCDKGVEVTF
nr:integrase, catalytic region, zinc finger, CCHC-type, peptidase aspartic, catalytic [Tanacetum cinerariifolium]